MPIFSCIVLFKRIPRMSILIVKFAHPYNLANFITIELANVHPRNNEPTISDGGVHNNSQCLSHVEASLISTSRRDIPKIRTSILANTQHTTSTKLNQSHPAFLLPFAQPSYYITAHRNVSELFGHAS